MMIDLQQNPSSPLKSTKYLKQNESPYKYQQKFVKSESDIAFKRILDTLEENEEQLCKSIKRLADKKVYKDSQSPSPIKQSQEHILYQSESKFSNFKNSSADHNSIFPISSEHYQEQKQTPAHIYETAPRKQNQQQQQQQNSSQDGLSEKKLDLYRLENRSLLRQKLKNEAVLRELEGVEYNPDLMKEIENNCHESYQDENNNNKIEEMEEVEESRKRQAHHHHNHNSQNENINTVESQNEEDQEQQQQQQQNIEPELMNSQEIQENMQQGKNRFFSKLAVSSAIGMSYENVEEAFSRHSQSVLNSMADVDQNGVQNSQQLQQSQSQVFKSFPTSQSQFKSKSVLRSNTFASPDQQEEGDQQKDNVERMLGQNNSLYFVSKLKKQKSLFVSK